MKPNQDIYTILSNSISKSPNKKTLQKLHTLTITFGFQKSLFLSTKLISKYSNFKAPNSSLRIFNQISTKNNAFVWNTIIRAMNRNGLFVKAVQLFDEMRKLGVKPDKYTFPSVINACGGLIDFDKGKFVHDCVSEMGFGSDLYICNALIDMYSRFGRLEFARQVFDEMPKRDIVSWNSLVSGYVSNGMFEEAVEVFFRLKRDGMVPDCFSLSSCLLACGGVGDVEAGRVVHGLVEKVGCFNDVIVGNALLSMYFKFGMVGCCWRVFDLMVCRDSVSWNTMVCGCCESGFCGDGIGLFREMVVGEFKPDVLTITSVFRACGYVGDLKTGKYVHDYMVGNGYECDVVTSNIIINMYAKCGDLVRSREVFEEMGSRDLVSWNSLINGYVENQVYEEAIDLFIRMRKMNLRADFVTYVSLLSVCATVIDITFTEELHCDVIKQGFDSTQIVGNALLDTYAKCGKMEDSLKQFESMKIRDTVTWNSMIGACANSESPILGFEMLSRMREEGILPDIPTFLSALPLCSYLGAKRQGKEMHGCILRLGFDSDTPIGNALIEMYSNMGSLRNSILVFEKMRERDLVSWTAVISSYGMHGEGRKALEAFDHMKADGIIPDRIVYIALLYACSHSGLVQEGRARFQEMKEDDNIEPRLENYASYVDLLSRSGLLAEAENFILSMPLQPDASIWGVLLNACRVSGDMKIAERVSKRVLELNNSDPGYQVLASNVYASLGQWDQVRMIRASLNAKGLKKDRGCSWLEL